MNLGELYKEKNRLSVYKKLSKDEELNIQQAISRIGLLKKQALDKGLSAAEVEGWSIPSELHETYALLHRYHLEVNDVPPIETNGEIK